MDPLAQQELAKRLASQAEPMSAQDVVRLALERFGRKVAASSSFGIEDMVLIDMLMRVDAKARIVTLDTGRLPQETYNVMDATRKKYGAAIEVFFPQAEGVQAMVAEHGLNLFYHSVELRKLCCGVRKMEPLKRALAGLDAWITGLRREQSVTRTAVHKVEWDESKKLIKLNPLADWTLDDTWRYIRENNVPHNALHDRGYPSIGCGPCTRAIEPGEDQRAGRWWWEHPETKECGLHVGPKSEASGSKS
ncbi:MAG: phosphoadenylyl-sulfate reductase [Acidobacteria bacterium]|nr:phosphoadenylyl-sulfate reductase [Acidobacteriota bacterium]